LSSAILYVAIVAIWAGVLIPRWLRRDSAASERYSEDLTTTEAHTEPDAEVAAEPAPPPRRREPTAPRAPVRPQVRAQVRAEPRPQPQSETQTRAEVPEGGPWGREHTKVLAARRRLLYMLLALAIGSGALAFTKMAAWWVVVPPTIMLLGYAGLLREAAKADADAERRELARTRATAAAAVEAARREAAPAPAPPAPAPDAEVINISASLTSAGQEFFDQYADAKLRAVGDLARRLTG